VYAAVEAARLDRLHSKLKAVQGTDKDGDVEVREGAEEDDEDAELAKSADSPTIPSADTMELDSGSAPSTATAQAAKKISTHGPRGSRREEWRASKGLNPRPKVKDMNRQGGIAAKRRPGRAHRRR